MPTSLLLFPLFAALLLLVAARAKRGLDALAPLQFASVLAGAILAMQAAGTQGVGCATTGIVLAMSGLMTTVLRKDRLAHQSAYMFDWEKFELDFHFYALTERLWRR